MEKIHGLVIIDELNYLIKRNINKFKAIRLKSLFLFQRDKIKGPMLAKKDSTYRNRILRPDLQHD